MIFRNIVGNPPFQDIVNRGKTQHKLWIDFTKKVVNMLPENGALGWVCPRSFSSPGNVVLGYIKKYRPSTISFLTNEEFVKVDNDVAISMCHFFLTKSDKNTPTKIITKNETFNFLFDDTIVYIPNDFCSKSISVHNKVMFSTTNKIKVEHDYVTCHNVLLRKLSADKCTISKTSTIKHVYPILHTNRQIWYSSIRQDFANKKKIMWSRSGETLPFYDDGIHGGTDMCYHVLVESDEQGKNMEHNLRSQLFRYIFKTAKWSGFGNEKVFDLIPFMPNKKLSDEEIYKFFNITNDEVKYVQTICK